MTIRRSTPRVNLELDSIARWASSRNPTSSAAELGQQGCLVLQLVDLAAGLDGGIDEALPLGFHLIGRDLVFRHLEIAGFDHIGRADRDTGRYA